MLHYLNDNLEHCTCSQEQVEEYLRTYFLGIDQSEPWRLKNTQDEYYSPDNATESCQSSQSGTMLAHSMENHGEDELTLFAEDFPAKIYPAQEKVLASKASDLECANTWHELSVRYDRDTHSWKTHLCLWDEDLQWSLVTLPKWGMMRNGECWAQSISVRHTDETESGLWPTPRACMTGAATPERLNDKNRNLEKAVAEKLWPTPNQRDWKDTGSTQGKRKSPNLGTMVHQKTWPTPQAHKTTESVEIVNADGTPWDGKSKPHSKTTGRPITTALADAVKFATPQARDFRTGSTDRWDNPERSRNLNDQIGGQLNPTWVEWLMGWLLGWTDLKPLEMDKFRKWLRSHGEF